MMFISDAAEEQKKKKTTTDTDKAQCKEKIWDAHMTLLAKIHIGTKIALL